MKKLIPSALVFVLAATVAANAQHFIIEPDNYSNGAILNHVIGPVSLTTAGADNLPIPPVPFDVTASYDGFGYTSTGTNVFGHAGVPFWNTNRRLRLDFNNMATLVVIDFIGGDLFTNDVAHLDAFNSFGTLVASYVSSPRAPGVVETMVVSRPAGDIAWAIAYGGPGDGSFLRFDHLELTVVPEPTAGALVLLGGVVFYRSISRLVRGGNRGQNPRAGCVNFP